VTGKARGELGLDHHQLAGVVVQQLEQRPDPQLVGALEGHLLDQLPSAGAEHVIEGGQDPFFGHHRVDLGLGRGAQRGELGAVADQFAQLPLRRRSDEGLGQIPAAQPVRQLGRVAHIVLDPPGVPVQAKRVHQMHVRAVGLEQIRRPIPAVGRLESDLRIGPGLATAAENSTGSFITWSTPST
jgi:hypothetical protein